MKTLSFLSAIVFCAALLSLPARAEDPQAIKLAPEIKAMLADLLKAADGELPAEIAPKNPTAPAAPTTPAAPTAPATPTTPAVPATPPPAPATALTTPTTPSAKANQQTIQPATGLKTSSLRASGLMTSAPLGGHGLLGGTPRLTDAEWRQQFPSQK